MTERFASVRRPDVSSTELVDRLGAAIEAEKGGAGVAGGEPDQSRVVQ